MKAHLLPAAGRLLIALALVRCQEATTHPEGETVAGQSVGVGPTLSPAISGAAGRTIGFHFVAHGDFGSANWTTEPDASGNFIIGNIEVNRGGSGSKAQVSLVYFIDQCDAVFNCSTIEGGVGLIPVGDLLGSGVNKLRLSTNTSTDPSFSLFAGVGGPISLEWERIPGFEARFTGISKVGVPGVFSSHSKGTSTFYQAKVTGSVVTLSVPPSQNAAMGTNQNVEMQHTFNQ